MLDQITNFVKNVCAMLFFIILGSGGALVTVLVYKPATTWLVQAAHLCEAKALSEEFHQPRGRDHAQATRD